MAIKVQQLESVNGSTKCSVNYHNKMERVFMVPDDKKDEFVKKYPKSLSTRAAFNSVGLVLACGLGYIGGNKLLSTISQNASKTAKTLAGVGGAVLVAVAGIASIGKATVARDNKLLNKYGAKEITNDNASK